PLEFKEEPIDDYPDIKEKEQLLNAESFDKMNENDPLYISNEVKEESLNIKEEPTDDFSDFKHEEPIADIFCPSTGIARPLDQSIPTIFSDAPTKSKIRRRTCVVCHRQCNQYECASSQRIRRNKRHG
ncbi:hypothetical protein PMAYCL1PPCAC_01163, partial [Pristionchus mayeri]